MDDWKRTSLKELGDRYESLVDKLRINNVTSLESLIIYAQIPSVRSGLLEQLKLKESEFEDVVAYANRYADSRVKSLPPLSRSIYSQFRCGVIFSEEVLKRRYDAFVYPRKFASAGPLPPSISHVHNMMPIRNQGNRGACTAFGTVAAAEFVRRPPERFSEQFVYWAAKMRSQTLDEDGLSIKEGILATHFDGLCFEREWPYNQNFIPGNVHHGPPPSQAIASALNHRIQEYMDVTLAGVDGLKAILVGSADYDPAIIVGGFMVFPSSYCNPLVTKTGRLTMPVPPDEQNVGGHCMAIVGYCDHEDSQQYPGGGYFILRNSWGTEWGAESKHGPGYGSVPYDFIIRRYMPEAYIIRDRIKSSSPRSEKPSGDRLEAIRKRLNM